MIRLLPITCLLALHLSACINVTAQSVRAPQAWAVGEVRVARPPLRAIPGPNRTVKPCRDAIEVAAEKFGAQKVEAVSAGPHFLDDEGYLRRFTCGLPTRRRGRLMRTHLHRR